MRAMLSTVHTGMLCTGEHCIYVNEFTLKCMLKGAHCKLKSVQCMLKSAHTNMLAGAHSVW